VHVETVPSDSLRLPHFAGFERIVDPSLLVEAKHPYCRESVVLCSRFVVLDVLFHRLLTQLEVQDMTHFVN
jgi:hypothetical protein